MAGLTWVKLGPLDHVSNVNEAVKQSRRKDLIEKLHCREEYVAAHRKKTFRNNNRLYWTIRNAFIGTHAKAVARETSE